MLGKDILGRKRKKNNNIVENNTKISQKMKNRAG